MFETSLIESQHQIKTKTVWTTMLSFGLQVTIITVMVLIPLIFTEALPTKQLMSSLVAPPPPPPPPPPPAQTVVVKKIQTDIVDGALRTPTKIPKKIVRVVEEEAPAPITGAMLGGVPGGVPGGTAGGVLGSVLGAANANAPKVAPQKVRISELQLGQAIYRPNPPYPAIAKAARIQGTVVLAATISKDGTIQNLRVISGPPMLLQGVMETVRTWRYKPYILNAEAVEVETEIRVNFSLSGG